MSRTRIAARWMVLGALALTAPGLARAQSDWRYSLVTNPGFSPQPYDIGNDGTIVGDTFDNNFGFIQKGLDTTTVYIPGSGSTFLTGIANNGAMSVSVWNSNFSRTTGGVRAPDGTITLLPRIQTHTWAMGLNDGGTVVGYSSDAAQMTIHGVVWNNSVPKTYDYPNATSTYIMGVNNAGRSAGLAFVGGSITGFTLENGAFTPVVYPGAGFSATEDINEKDQLIGIYSSADANQHGYLLSNGQFTSVDFPDVKAQFPATLDIGGAIYTQTDFEATQPFGLNDRGDFVGFIASAYNAPDGSFAGYLKTGFVATAVPEPGNLTLLCGLGAVSGLALLRRHRRR